ncbi:MAG: tetratricopeptide repeat protein [Candidatus Melainabacteria bacterium]|nr:tetratricopeptide repeat protein [Candidatus Melainabacteria bacterium]
MTKQRIQTNFLEKQAAENSKRGTNRGIVIALLSVLGAGILFAAYSLITYLLNFQQNQHVRNVAIVLKTPRLAGGKALVDVEITNANAYPISNPLVRYTIANQANEQIAAGQVQLQGTIPAADQRVFLSVPLDSVSGQPARMHADLTSVQVKEKDNLPTGFPARFSHSLLFSQGQERIAALDTLLKEKPDFAPAHTAIGRAYEESGSYREAIKHYRRACEIAPDHANPHYHLGVALLHEKLTEEGKAELEKARQLDPQDPAVEAVLKSLSERPAAADEAAAEEAAAEEPGIEQPALEETAE